MNPAAGFEHLPGERRVVYISAILGIIVAIAWFVNRAKGAPVPQSAPVDGAPDPSAGYDPNAALEAEKAVSLASIEHSAGLEFSIAQNNLSHDLGYHSTSGSGSGGLNIGGLFGIGGSGSKSGQDQWDLTTQSDFAAGFTGDHLSADEFQMLIEEGQALVNAGHNAQTEVDAVGVNKLNRYKAPPSVGKAPAGHHLEIGPNGVPYWVKDGASINAHPLGL